MSIVATGHATLIVSLAIETSIPSLQASMSACDNGCTLECESVNDAERRLARGDVDAAAETGSRADEESSRSEHDEHTELREVSEGALNLVRGTDNDCDEAAAKKSPEEEDCVGKERDATRDAEALFSSLLDIIQVSSNKGTNHEKDETLSECSESDRSDMDVIHHTCISYDRCKDPNARWPHHWTWSGLGLCGNREFQTELERSFLQVARLVCRLKISERAQAARELQNLISRELCSEPDSEGVLLLQQALKERMPLDIIQIIANVTLSLQPCLLSFDFFAPRTSEQNFLESRIFWLTRPFPTCILHY